MASARRILILGEGDGRFLAALRRVNGGAEIDVVDNSVKMLGAAKRRTSGERVHFHHADARSWQPPTDAHYDLIVTHFFLDCFSDNDLELMVPRLLAACAVRCDWVVSEFRQPAKGLSAWRARLWIGALYRLFGWTTGLRVRRLPDYGVALEKNGFQRVRGVVANAGLLTSEWWERRGIFTFDAPAHAPLHSRTPKS